MTGKKPRRVSGVRHGQEEGEGNKKRKRVSEN